MANPRHLDLLKQGGVDAWNRNLRFKPDLINADLINADLSGVDLSGVNLRGAHLINAYLINARLINAYLNGADLSGADLSGSHLSGAHLINTRLSGATLSRADLNEADLSGADLSNAQLINAQLIKADLNGATLSGVDLSGADLSGAHLINANLVKATLRGVDLSGADLSGADLSGADLSEANLSGANLSGANLSGAHLIKADLIRATFIHTDLANANLTQSNIFAIAAWDVLHLESALQKDLVITEDHGEYVLTVDNIECAQFIYLILDNQKILDVINTITSKVVLILGRFTDERKRVLDTLREELRKYNYLSVVFDFDPSAQRDLTETISTLAHMSRFIIADLTNARSVPQELERIVPHLPSVPVQPILRKGAKEYAMFKSYKAYPWVLPIYRYKDIPGLLTSIEEHIIKPVEEKKYEKDEKKALEEEVRRLKEENRKLRGEEQEGQGKNALTRAALSLPQQ